MNADPDKIARVLANLVENAVKYSPDGGLVDVEVGHRDAVVAITVRDEGLGVPAEDRERIFEKFFRLDPHLTRGVGGQGLGLYICRGLVETMGGRIWAEGREGRGSAFVVELPVAEPDAPFQPAGWSRSPASATALAAMSASTLSRTSWTRNSDAPRA